MEKLLGRQRKHAFFHPQRTTNCRATIEWGVIVAQHGFHLVAGGAISTGGLFLTLNLAANPV
jgi:hypothetical protein